MEKHIPFEEFESELKVNGMNSAKDIDLVRKAKQLREELLSE